MPRHSKYNTPACGGKGAWEPITPQMLKLAGLFLAWIMLIAPAVQPAHARDAGGHWSPAWTASMFEARSSTQVFSVDNETFRSQVRVSAGGSAIRVRLSNEYGRYLKLGAVTVRKPNSIPQTVTFGGAASVVLPDHGPLISDPIALAVEPFDLVEVSIFVAEKAEIHTVHIASGSPTDISAPGDFSGTEFVAARHHISRPLITGIDVFTSRQRPIVIAFGDSITDNTGCTNDAQPVCRWSDVLARRLAADNMPHVVITQAISGNRVLAEGAGPSALQRLDRDVLAFSGVTHLILLEGINDIGNSGRARSGFLSPTITAHQLIEGYRQIVDRARAHGIKVIGMTLLPFEGAAYQTVEGELLRDEVNRWIRESGAFDAVVDTDKIMADPANSRRLSAALQHGDNLHPNAAGQNLIGNAIPLGIFR